jgi:hypothetical protein
MRLAVRRIRLAIPALAIVAAVMAATAPPAAAFRDRDCSDFPTQAAAQRFFKRHNPNRDPHRLDADNDGIACEDNP